VSLLAIVNPFSSAVLFVRTASRFSTGASPAGRSTCARTAPIP
jgi:hypothetical protein